MCKIPPKIDKNKQIGPYGYDKQFLLCFNGLGLRVWSLWVATNWKKIIWILLNLLGGLTIERYMLCHMLDYHMFAVFFFKGYVCCVGWSWSLESMMSDFLCV